MTAHAIMTRSIRRFVRYDGSPQSVALEKLGFDPVQLSEMSRRQQFNAICERLAGMESKTERAVIAWRIFGRDFARVIEVIGWVSA